MQMRRAPRVLVTGFLLTLAVAGLAGCRTSPNVAAYVGDDRITVDRLDREIDQRLEDQAVAAYAASDEDGFTRLVLGLLVQEDVHAAAAERYDVLVGDDDVRARITELLGGQDPEAVYAQLAQRGLSRTDVFENVRQQLVRQRIAEAQGLAEGLSEQELRARYDEIRESLGRVQLGYITVPDQATADAVLAQLTADPASYPALAGQHAGDFTLPAMEPRSPDQIPGPIAQGVAAAAPNTGFTLPVQETGGIVVAFVGETTYPTFEEVRPDLEQQAASAADDAAQKLVDEVRADLDITVNPRYGRLEDGQIQPVEGGVVDILGQDAA